MSFQPTDTLVNACKRETVFISMVNKELKLKAKKKKNNNNKLFSYKLLFTEIKI